MVFEKPTKVNDITVSKKDFQWEMEGTEYKILNVPYERIDADGEEFVDLVVATKMEMIRELMIAKRIPPIVDYEVVADLEIDL